jgi:hypothetical protein
MTSSAPFSSAGAGTIHPHRNYKLQTPRLKGKILKENI